MKLASFFNGETACPAIIDEGWCIDWARAEAAYRRGSAPRELAAPEFDSWQLPRDVKTFVAGGAANLRIARRLLEFARTQRNRLGESAADESPFQYPLELVRLRTPIPNPYMLAEIETNSAAQYQQRGLPQRSYPPMMILPDNVLNDPGGCIVLPFWAKRVSVSAQLAFVCGGLVEGATPSEAGDAVFGYTLSLCFSTSGLVDMLANPNERDLSVNEDYGRWLDGFRPVGPWIVTRDEFDLHVPRTLYLVVGSEQIISSTSAMLHTPSRIISALSEHIPFYPGDVVGLGAMGRDTAVPAELPTDGLEVSVTVEGLGTLATRVKRAVEPG